MEARLNRSWRFLSAGTKVEILTDPKDYDHPNFHGFDNIRLLTPPSKKMLDVVGYIPATFDIECNYLTPCRPMTELVPLENRHKRREKKRNEYELLQRLGV